MFLKKHQHSQESLSPGHGGLGSAAGRKHTYGTPDGSSKYEKKRKKICRFWHAFSLKPALPQLYAYAKSTTESKKEGEKGEWEPASAQRGGGGEDRKGAEERGQAEGGRIRVRVVKKKSKEEVVGCEVRRGREHSDSNADTRSLATLF